MILQASTKVARTIEPKQEKQFFKMHGGSITGYLLLFTITSDKGERKELFALVSAHKYKRAKAHKITVSYRELERGQHYAQAALMTK